MWLQHMHTHLALLLCSLFFHLLTFMLSVFPSSLGFIFDFLGHRRFSASFSLLLLSLHTASVMYSIFSWCLCISSHSFILRNDLSFSVFWTQTVDHALIYFSSLLFLLVCFSLPLALHHPFIWPSYLPPQLNPSF